jgi:hypothetical protein
LVEQGSCSISDSTQLSTSPPINEIKTGNRIKYTSRKPKGKRSLGRSRRRWVDNIKMNLGVLEWGGVDWSGLAHDRDRWRALVDSAMSLRVP